jgi:folylpolyglutamate synthase/dihydropteroate synthase
MRQKPSVLEVFQKQCDELNAILHTVPVDRSEKINFAQLFLLKLSFSSSLNDLSFKIEYDVQLENACLSKAVLNYLNVSPEGMNYFYWPCRMELFNHFGTQIVLDGCHNEDRFII